MKVITIGRDETNDIQFENDPHVTRSCHCQIIEEDNGSYYLVDFSTNGTFVNNSPVKKRVPVSLRKSDVIRIGSVTPPLRWMEYFNTGTGATIPEPQSVKQSNHTPANQRYNGHSADYQSAPSQYKAVETPSGWDCYAKCWSHYADFSGRARRKEYWMFVLFNLLFILVAAILDNLLGISFEMDGISIGYGPIYVIYALSVFLPGLAVLFRRLHDTSRSGWNILWSLLPLVGGIILLVYVCQDSVSGYNQYGENPKR
jgi:uncharacterized membrane protein YhaH (DUF805 family)